MRTHTLAGTAATALLLGAFAAGGMTLAGDRDTARQATSAAAKASKALGKGDAAHAVAFAENAVSLSPRDADYRLLLGQSYLKAGRFASATTAFADTLTLAGDAGPAVAKAALNLALAQIATGQWDLARTTLSEHAAVIPARDRGLALALAGDPNGGVEVLMAAARLPESDARTRQNLALALTLSGRWADAKTILSADMPDDQVKARLASWVEFARPHNASDQVAKLLGVTAAADSGQPTALALADPASAVSREPETQVAAAEANTPALVQVAASAPTVELAQLAATDASPRIVFAQRQEVVQPLPTVAARAARMIATKGAFKQPVVVSRTVARVAAAAPTPAKGQWFVQLGAFDSAGVAQDAWKRATRRYASLSAHTPAGMAFRANSGAFYRLSVGGFAREDAVAMCRGIRARGGACFVRAGAGDQIAAWVKPSKVQTAVAKVRGVKPKSAAVQVAAR